MSEKEMIELSLLEHYWRIIKDDNLDIPVNDLIDVDEFEQRLLGLRTRFLSKYYTNEHASE